MALAQAAAGPTTTDGTEQTLATLTTGKTFVFKIDTFNMALDDEIEVRIKDKVLSGGTTRLAYMVVYKHVQADPIKISPPVPALRELVVTLKRTGGTDKGYDWVILSLD